MMAGSETSPPNVPGLSTDRRALLKGGTAVLFFGALGAAAAGARAAAVAGPGPGMASADPLAGAFDDPPAEAGLGAYWYWLDGGVTRAGITADLEAMHANGITTAMLFAIGGSKSPPLVDPPADALTPGWWALVTHAVAEADRLGMTIAMNICDGWATASGPWITPELSMQLVTWSEARAVHGATGITLPPPPRQRDYYRDTAVLAFPWPATLDESSTALRPRLATTLPLAQAPLGALLDPANARDVFDTDQPGHVDFAFDAPFTLRSVTVRTPSPWGYSPGVYRAANSLQVLASDDGVAFRPVGELEYPQHGWQTGLNTLTHALPETTARVFRFVHVPIQPPGYQENYDFGQDTRLRLYGLELSSCPQVHQLEGKSAAQWSISRRTTVRDVPDAACVAPASILDLSDRLRADGRLDWSPPPGRWRILRIGATTNGRENSAAGGAQGLEVDRLDADAVRLQFERWFGTALEHVGPALAGRVLRTVHVDSWEASSQNWSPRLPEAFQRLRGYALRPWLAAMAGVPIASAAATEGFLHDLRRTLAELTQSEFFATVARLAHERGCLFSGEPASPTYPVDGLRWADATDLPMGEFWLRTPRNDKPTDVADAVSGGHVYGKRVIATESFTENEIRWDEHPALLKPLGDRHYCRGVNRFMLHVYTAQPFLDREPGMTLNGIGTVFSRTQTWWPQARGWFDYMRRCQAVLQQGVPVNDIAVFIGEELPSRALLPAQLDAPIPAGYRHDSINRDALLRLATVKDGCIVLPGGARYALLVLPREARHTSELLAALARLVADGATVLAPPTLGPIGLEPEAEAYAGLVARLWGEAAAASGRAVGERRIGKGRLAWGTTPAALLAATGPAPSLLQPAGEALDWTHRRGPGWQAWFIANGSDRRVEATVSLRGAAGAVECWRAEDGVRAAAPAWRVAGARTELPLALDAGASVIVVLRDPPAGALAAAAIGATVSEARFTGDGLRLETGARGTHLVAAAAGSARLLLQDGRRVQLDVPAPPPPLALRGPWTLDFSGWRAPRDVLSLATPVAWTSLSPARVRCHSGSGRYRTRLRLPRSRLAPDQRLLLDLGEVREIAEVWINGGHVATCWMAPFVVDVTRALRPGGNLLEVRVTNTWHNRLAGDRSLPEGERIAWVYPALRGGQEWLPRADAPLLPAGLIGPVRLRSELLVGIPA